MIKKVLFCLIIFVAGCSTSNQDTQYYVLSPNIPITTNELIVTNNEVNVVVLQPIKIAEFLDQPGIVLQNDNHQIEVAHYHRWGEPLKRNLHRYIFETLSISSPNHIIQSNSEVSSASNSKKLEITINKFNGTTNGLALLSGNWTFSNSDINKKSFSYHAKLSKDGYPELIKELALLLDQLCNDIAHSIKST